MLKMATHCDFCLSRTENNHCAGNIPIFLALGSKMVLHCTVRRCHGFVTKNRLRLNCDSIINLGRTSHRVTYADDDVFLRIDVRYVSYCLSLRSVKSECVAGPLQAIICWHYSARMFSTHDKIINKLLTDAGQLLSV